ncbi:MAG: TlpA family protein disulfide reductase [Nocardioides sp.]|nr:TlpA family protein disulfide reductase [Nocardioides sp.]
MRRLAWLVVAVGLVLAATGCTSLQGTGDKGYVTGDGAIRTIPMSDRGGAISLSGRDLDGKPLSLESMRGKPTVVTVWGSWCASCRKDSPYLVEAQKKLGSKVNFVGIDSRDAGTAQAKAYNQRFGIGWPSFFSPGGEALLAFPGVLTPNSVPATVVLDAHGRPAVDINGGVPSTLTLVQLVQDVVRHG